MIIWQCFPAVKPAEYEEVLVRHEQNEYNVAQLIHGMWWSTVLEASGDAELPPVTHFAYINAPEDV